MVCPQVFPPLMNTYDEEFHARFPGGVENFCSFHYGINVVEKKEQKHLKCYVICLLSNLSSEGCMQTSVWWIAFHGKISLENFQFSWKDGKFFPMKMESSNFFPVSVEFAISFWNFPILRIINFFFHLFLELNISLLDVNFEMHMMLKGIGHFCLM